MMSVWQIRHHAHRGTNTCIHNMHTGHTRYAYIQYTRYTIHDYLVTLFVGMGFAANRRCRLELRMANALPLLLLVAASALRRARFTSGLLGPVEEGRRLDAASCYIMSFRRYRCTTMNTADVFNMYMHMNVAACKYMSEPHFPITLWIYSL
jgi:hypothetical protein